MCGDFTRPPFAYHQAEHFADNMHNILTPDNNCNNCFLLHAAPDPPSLTVTPLYDSSEGLLEIESQATEGVGG